MTQVEQAVREVFGELQDRVEEESDRMDSIYHGRKYKEKYHAMGRINGLEEALDLLEKTLSPYMEFDRNERTEWYEEGCDE